MLQIVEQQQGLGRAQVGDEAGRKGLAAPFPQPPRLGERGNDQRGVMQGRQVHEGDAVCEAIRDAFGHREGQARLADPAGAGQREQLDVIALQ